MYEFFRNDELIRANYLILPKAGKRGLVGEEVNAKINFPSRIIRCLRKVSELMAHV